MKYLIIVLLLLSAYFVYLYATEDTGFYMDMAKEYIESDIDFITGDITLAQFNKNMFGQMKEAVDLTEEGSAHKLVYGSRMHDDKVDLVFGRYTGVAMYASGLKYEDEETFIAIRTVIEKDSGDKVYFERLKFTEYNTGIKISGMELVEEADYRYKLIKKK